MVVEIIKKILIFLDIENEALLLASQINNITNPVFTIDLTGIDTDRVNAILCCLNIVKDRLCQRFHITKTSEISSSMGLTLTIFGIKKGRIVKADGKDVNVVLSYYPQQLNASNVVIEYTPKDFGINGLLPQELDEDLLLYGTIQEYLMSKGLYEKAEYFGGLYDDRLSKLEKVSPKIYSIKKERWIQ